MQALAHRAERTINRRDLAFAGGAALIPTSDAPVPFDDAGNLDEGGPCEAARSPTHHPNVA